MPLLGKAAMLLSFEVDDEAAVEHDDWHTHEHLPERLSIPGFLRGTRWRASNGQSSYLVLYEVANLETLTSGAYLERLNRPSAWTARMMPHYRGMRRGLCSVVGSSGFGMGHFGLLIRFGSQAGLDPALGEWLLRDLLPELPARSGLGSAHLLRGAMAAQMTTEQEIRGADAGVDWALLVTGYSEDAVAALLQTELAASRFEAQGAEQVIGALYRSAYTLTDREIDVRPSA